MHVYGNNRLVIPCMYTVSHINHLWKSVKSCVIFVSYIKLAALTAYISFQELL